MEKKVHYTNEKLSKQFKSNFELVNYAIRLADNMIKTGRDARVKSDVQNRAMLILEEIHEGKDQLDEMKGSTVLRLSTDDFVGNELHNKYVVDEPNNGLRYKTIAEMESN